MLSAMSADMLMFMTTTVTSTSSTTTATCMTLSPELLPVDYQHHLGVIDDYGGSSPSSRVHTPRPGLSRTSSVSSMALADADDTFSGLTLLDLLVALDAHVDLAHRELKKKGQQLKNKAESTAIQVKRSAGAQLRRRATGRTSGAHSGDNARESDIDELAPEEVFDRELQKFRHKVSRTRL
jgi:hypothetical protein